MYSDLLIIYTFTYQTIHKGNGITAVGTNTGIYRVHNDSSTADLMLPVGKVLQMATMSPKANLLLVLTGKKLRLYVYNMMDGLY